jgi:hypothetical protein
MADNWQPIESAPKDGTRIDVFAEGRRWPDSYWSGGPKRGCWWAPNWDYDGMDGPTCLAPTHWMPIPPPPAADQ